MPSAYERRIANYLASHPGASRAEARGHQYTPEHGRGALAGVDKRIPLVGHELRSTYSDRQAMEYINKAADQGARVRVSVHTVNGWKQAGGDRGYSASYVAELQAKAGSLRSAVVHDFGRGGDDYDMPKYEDSIDAWQLDILE